MRWGSLISTVLLTAGSMVIPRLAFNSMGLDMGNLPGVVGSLGKLQSGQGLDAMVAGQMKALQGGDVEAVPLEQLAAIQDMAKSLDKQADAAAALARAFKEQKPLGEQLHGQILRDSETLRRAYRDQRPRVIAGFAVLAALTLAVLLLGAVPAARGLARFYLEFLFALCGKCVIMVSLSTAVYFAVAQFNPWPLLPPEILYFPSGLMVLTSLFIKMLDPNYPVWNSLLQSLSAPVLACLAIAAMGRINLRQGA